MAGRTLLRSVDGAGRELGRHSKKRGRRAGFTAAELMLAITAAMTVCAGAYMLAKSSLDVFQQEARMNAAQFANVSGMNRLTTDAKRAGYLSSADAATDPNVCAASGLGIEARIVAANVFEFSSPSTYAGGLYPALPGVVTTTNKRNPDRLQLSGNFSTSEKFKMLNVDSALGKISIDPFQLSVQRIFRESTENGGTGPTICQYFAANQIIRMLDNMGKSRFNVVSTCTVEPSPPTVQYDKITLQLAAAPIPSLAGCGELTNGYVNPVNIIDYVPIHLDAANSAAHGIGTTLAQLMDQDSTIAGVTGDQSRLALVRRELNGVGAIVPNSSEVVADYLVDLNFSGRVANNINKPNELTTMRFDEKIGTAAKNRVRALGIRLTTRSRYADREGAPVAPNEDQPLQKFEVFDATATNRFRFARVRTMFSEVSISNLMGAVPW